MKEQQGRETTRKELQYFERVLEDPALADNVLILHMQRLLGLTKELKRDYDRLKSKNQQLESHLADYLSYLNQSSRIDPLTRLPNRRELSERLVREESRSQRHWRKLSLLQVSVDELGQLHELHGQNACDELLVEIACQLQGFVRSEDVCGRWAGEEFMLLLPETGIEGAVSVAEKIVSSIAQTEFRIARPGLRTTVSVAVGEFRADQGIQDLLADMDRGVQRAKQAGKDRYVIV